MTSAGSPSAKGSRTGPKPARLLRWTAVGLGSILAVSLAALTWAAVTVPRPTVFDVVALTERLEFRPAEGPRSRWVLDEALLVDGGMGSARPFTGSFEPADSTTVIIERIALGPIWIQVRAERPGASAGTLYSENDEMIGVAPDRIDFEIHDVGERAAAGRTTVLPLRGAITTGRPVAFETGGTTAVLRSGRVQLLAVPHFGSTAFAAGEVRLEAGDEFRVLDARGQAHGMVTADERPALTVAYRTEGREAAVIRPSGGEYPVSISFLDRTLRDPLFRALSLLMGGLVGLATVLTFLIEAGRLWPRGAAALLALAASTVFAPPLEAQQVTDPEVWVQGQSIGQGALRARGRECVVVTPHHVIGEAPPVFILVIGPDGLTTRGTVAASYEPDLAVVRLDDSNPFPCGAWRSGFDAYDELGGGESAVLRIREEDGSLSLVPVTIRSVQREYVLVRTADPDTPIMQTMSGATLMVANRPMGMLLRLLESGEGEVYQIDDIQRRTQPFFDLVSERTAPEVELDLPTALSLLDRAMEARDGSAQGQGDALETLLALGYAYEGTDLSGISFRGANLTGGAFRGADFSAADLSDTEGADIRLDEARLVFTRMDGAHWPEASLSRVYGPFLAAPSASLPGAILSGANLTGADLQGADLRDADLRGAALAFADLRGARLDGADLSGAYLMGAVLDGATFEGATIAETDLTAAVAAEPPFSAEQARGACSHRRFSGSWFHWTVEVMEAWDSDRYSTGREYDDAIRVAEGFQDFPIYEARPCEASPDQARGFYADSEPHIARIGVERTYFSKAGRRTEFRRRIEAHFQLLRERMSEERRAVR